MNSNYYDEQIKREQKKLNIYARLVDVGMRYLQAKNNRKQNALFGAWTKVKYAKDGRERSARLKTLLKVLNEENSFKSRTHTSSEVSKAIRDSFRGTQIELDYTDASKFAYEISYDAKKSIEKYALEYVRSLDNIERFRRQQAKEASEVKEPKKETNTVSYESYTSMTPSTYQRDETPVYATTSNPRRTDKDNVMAGGKVVYTKYDSFEEREKKAMAYLDEKIEASRKRSFGKFFFTTDEEIMLRKVLGDDKYLGITDLVEEGLAMQDVLYRLQTYERDSKLPFKKPGYTPNLNDIVDVALGVYRHLPEELMMKSYALNPEGRYAIKLRSKSKMSNSLEIYEKIYAIYLNYYNRLSDEDKLKIKNTFNTNGAYDYYKKTFNIVDFEIISPSKLKLFVNRKVSEKLVESYLDYMDDDIEHYNTLARAVTYMDIGEIASVYASIKAKYEMYFSVMPGKDEQKQVEASMKRKAALQKNFVNVILSKMNVNGLSLEEKNKKIEYIIKEVLHEQPMFELDLVKEPEENAQEVVSEKEEERTVKSSDGMYHYVAGTDHERTSNRALAARYNAQHRFFGMSKLEQTLAKMSGKWARFGELWDRALTTNEAEQHEIADELDLMFRRK